MASSRLYHKLTSSSVQSYSLSPPITDVGPSSISVSAPGERNQKLHTYEAATPYGSLCMAEPQTLVWL